MPIAFLFRNFSMLTDLSVVPLKDRELRVQGIEVWKR